MKKILFTLIAILCLNVSSALAWGTTGHRVVAEVAEQHLNRKAKRAIKKIIGDQKLAYWANWPDFIKSDPSWKYADGWHYVNIPGNLSRDAFDKELEASTDANLYKKALFFIEELKDKNLSLKKKQEYLYFLVHMIGDAHQPLHIGRFEDLGGNKVSVEWFRKKTNLHTLWDSKLVDFEQYSYTEYTRVLNIHDKKYNAQLASGTLLDWIYDSYSLANEIYKIEPEASLSYRYHFDHKQNVESQLLKGGLRLAKVLNSIFG